MKPVKLIMTAFGPYASKQTIDFAELGSRSMFVVSGKTGSGKTTIFDAICFAVYGKPSGDKRSASEMRSHFAHYDTQTEVELIFELRGRLYTIRRKPQQDKPKARGNGTTTVTASAELFEHTEEGKERMIAANVRDTDEKIHELIGLEANQFRQILMIPQGEFQKLLFSSSQDKEKILQKLFHTAFYKSVEEKLKERADELKKQAGRAMDEQRVLLKSLPAYSGEMAALLEEEASKEIIFRRLDIDLGAMQEKLSSKQVLMQQQSQKRDDLLNEREQSRAVNKQFEKLDQLQARSKELDGQQEKIAALKVQIKQGERAEKLLPYEEMAEQAAAFAEKAVSRFEQASDSADKIKQKRDEQSASWQQQQHLQPERDKLLKQRQYLEQLKPLVKAFDAAAEKEKNSAAMLKQAAEKKSELGKQEKKLVEQIEALEAQMQKLQTAKERLMETEQQIDRIQRQQEQLAEWAELEQEYRHFKQREDAAQKLAEQTKTQAEAASLMLLHLKKQVKQQEAAAWAQELEQGKPCPVCGSVDHPLPAVYEESKETAEAAAQAEQTAAALLALQAKHEQEAASFAVTAARVQKEQEKVKSKLPECSFAESNELLQEAQKTKVQAEADLKQKLQVNKELHAAKEKKKEVSDLLGEIHQVEAEKQAMYAEAKAELSHLIKTVPESLRETRVFDSLLAETSWQYEKQIALFEQTKQLFQTYEADLQAACSVVEERKQVLAQAKKAHEQAEKTLLAKQTEAGFTAPEFQEAKRLLAGLAGAKESVAVFEKEQQETKSRIQELTKELSGKTKQELEWFEEKLAEIDGQLAAGQAEAGRLTAQIEESVRIRRSVEAAAAKLASVEQEYRLSGHLYDVAHGKNELKITFERYVLASFLEDILIAANGRLAAMTNGRFMLERQKNRAKGNAQSGLDLLVFDQYTGMSRTVKTLSGGESFKAALSLALGLAEVVQNFAGGVSLETMFVDEGFGTLDPESLDQAIETLLDIQADGRLVGIISHVPELKERIDARLEVYQSELGSKAAFVFTGEAQ